MGLEIQDFGKFRLLQKIARGGMAEIFLACTGNIESAHKFVVIKRISLMHEKSQEFKKMFKNEGKVAISLNHSNIGSIYEFGMEGSQYFICMEYISGRNLRQLVKKVKSQKKKLSVEFCAHVIKYVCSGLDYAHNCTDNITGQALNIIHRDISPQNIMISFSGNVKVIDFGIAKIDDSEATKVGVLKGKFEYMSPEQARGKDIGKQTDIFSLGNVLWELLAGRKLFTGANEIQLLKKIRECQIPDLQKINPQVPDKLASIINKALKANKHLRYKTVAEMENDISIFLNKHYPDWTPSHFNSFIKELYIEEIMEERQSLKTYAQALKKASSSRLPINKRSNTIIPETYSSKFKGYTKEFEEKTKIAEAEETGAYSKFDETVSIIDEDFKDEDSHYTETETKSNMNEQQATLTKTKFDDPLDSKTAPPLTNSYILNNKGANRNTIVTSDREKPLSSYTPWHSEERSSLSNQKRKLIRHKRKKRRLLKVAISLCVLGALPSSYFFSPTVQNQVLNLAQTLKTVVENQQTAFQQDDTQETTSNKMEPAINNTERSPNSVSTQSPGEPAPAPAKKSYVTKTVWLETTPSGAQVFVNGVMVKDTTPTDILINSRQPTKLLLKKHGYSDKTVTLSLTKNQNKVKYSLKKIKGAKRSEITVIR